MITTICGDMDESTLLKHEGGIDNDVECTTWVEYCLPHCQGEAHRTGLPVGTGCFCPEHIHRSVSMRLKHGLFGAGLAADFG